MKLINNCNSSVGVLHTRAYFVKIDMVNERVHTHTHLHIKIYIISSYCLRDSRSKVYAIESSPRVRPFIRINNRSKFELSYIKSELPPRSDY